MPPMPKAKPKSNSLKAQAARRRASKRRRVEESSTPEVKDEGDDTLADGVEVKSVETDGKDPDTFGGFKWELVAITVAQYQEFIESLKKTRDPAEKQLRDYIQDEVIPIIEKGEESQRRKIERKERELLNLQKLAGAKRSSRLADKQDRERQEREAAEVERKRAADLAAAHQEQQRQQRMEQDRQSRMMTREQRIKDREYKRLLHEEELARIEEEAKKVEAGEARGSERHLKAQMEKRKKDLESLSAEEDWVFDCSGCGIYGRNVVCVDVQPHIKSVFLTGLQDDGAHSVACEKCNVWQHSKCLGITKAEAEKEDFHFICKDCKQRIEDAKKPKISLKFRTSQPSSPSQPRNEGRPPSQEAFADIKTPKKRGPGRPPGTTRPTSQGSQTNGRALPYPTQPARSGGSAYLQQPILNGYGAYANGHQSMGRPQQGSPYPNGYGQAGQTSSFTAMASPNGYGARHNPPSNEPGSFAPSSNSAVYARPASSHGQYPPYPNGVVYQYQHYSSQSPPSRPASSHSPNFYRAYSSTSQAVNNTTNAHIPSPVLNRPTMSPTQGNQDVGPTAGVPQKSPSPSYGQSFAQHRTPSMYQSNGNPPYYFQTTPAPLPRSPNMKHMSGLSPTKHSPIISPPTHVQQNSSMSPPSSAPGSFRSVSGTPIFPPVENLAPSPEQLSKTPVPTPSKNASPGQVGEAELIRVNMEAAAAMNLPQQAGQ